MKQKLNQTKSSYIKDVYLDNVIHFKDKLISFTDKDQNLLNPIHIIYGQNGIGKTNFLKLISYFKDMFVTPLTTITSKIKPLVKDLTKDVHLAINLNDPISKDTYLYYIKLNYQKGTFQEVIELKTNDFHQLAFVKSSKSTLTKFRQDYKQIYNAKYLINNLFKYNAKQPPLEQSRQNGTVKKVKKLLAKIMYIESVSDLERYLKNYIIHQLDSNKRKITTLQKHLDNALKATIKQVKNYELNIEDIRFNYKRLEMGDYELETLETHKDLYTKLKSPSLSNGTKHIILLSFVLELQKIMEIQILYNDIGQAINPYLMEYIIENHIQYSSGLIASTDVLSFIDMVDWLTNITKDTIIIFDYVDHKLNMGQDNYLQVVRLSQY